jgi:Kelch motif protein
MQHSLNRATIPVADTTDVSGRVTTGSIKHELYAKKTKWSAAAQQFNLNKNMKKKIISFVFPLFVCAAAYAQGITWTPANPMNKARAFFTATKLFNGDVLVAGGYDGTIFPPIFPDAEIYNRQTGLWTPISPMNLARAAAVDVRLEDGRVLVIGGADADFNFLDSAEIYDPSTGTWSFTGSMNEPRFEDFVGVLLPGHKVLIAGGFGPPFNALNSAEIYDEATNTWTPTGSMNVARAEFAHVVLHDGRVLAVGGVADDPNSHRFGGDLRSSDGRLDFNREHEYRA